MKTKKWTDIKSKGKSAERVLAVQQKVHAELLAMDLRELRKFSEKTQEDVAEILEATQSEISRMEGRGDRLVSSLRKYVEALGGELEIVAVMGKKRIALSGL